MADIRDESIMEKRMKSCEDLADRFMEGLYEPSEQSLREQVVSLALAASFVGQALALNHPKPPNQGNVSDADEYR